MIVWDATGIQIETSCDTHECLVKLLGDERAIFNGNYDIPLRIITVDEDLPVRLIYGEKHENRDD